VNVDDYRRDGYLIVPGLFSEQEVHQLKEDCRSAVAERPKNAHQVHVFTADAITDPLKRAVCDERLVSVLARLIDSRVEFLSVKPVYKSADIGFASPWHQDWQYWKGTPKISAWVALDAATVDNGCLRVVPGSHLKSWDHEQASDDIGFGNRISEEQLAKERIVDVEVNAGDALFFHDLLLHASHPNTSGRDRWSIIPTYRDACIPDPDTVSIWKDSILL
jgi:phytanoyl-CoA hydroxylase